MRSLVAGLLVWSAVLGQEATIKTTSQEVLLDLVVRDKKGHLVKDLKAEEITVTDDGVKQQIRSLRLRTGAEISTIQETPLDPQRRPQQTAVRKPTPPINPLRDVRVVTFAFDPLPNPNANNDRTSNTSVEGGDRRLLVKKMAEELLKADIGANFYWGVFLMGRGRVNVVQPYTTDKDKLLRAVDKAVMAPGVAYSEASDAVAAMTPVAANGVAAGTGAATAGSVNAAAEASAAMAAVAANMVEFEQDTDRNQRGRDDFFAISNMIRELQRLPGRKTLIYFTKGLMIAPEFNSEFKAVIAHANRANVTIYCVDPTVASTGFANNGTGTKLLGGAASASASNMQKRNGPVTRSEALVLEHAEAAVTTNTHMAPVELAEDTGGFVIANLSDTAKIVARLSEEINTYYEVTYTPTIDTYDGHFRKIGVRIARNDVKVQSRSGYFALPYIPGQTVFPYEMPMLNALATTPPPKAIPFKSGVKYFGSTAEVVFDVPLANITMVKDTQAKTFRCNLALLGLFKDSTGNIVKKVTREVPVTNSLDNLNATLAGHFIYTHHVELPPGRYTFESAILDRESDQSLTSVKKQSVVVTPRPELAVSSLMLVRKLSPPSNPVMDADDPLEFKEGRITPELNESVKGGKGANVGLYFVGYAQQPAGDAKLTLDFVLDGKLVARSEPPVPAMDDKGRIHVVTNLPIETLKPGQYELYARIAQNGKTAQDRLLLNIEE